MDRYEVREVNGAYLVYDNKVQAFATRTLHLKRLDAWAEARKLNDQAMQRG